MTINIDAFEDLRLAVETTGPDRLVGLKKQIAENVARREFAARKGEDATGAYYLYLDALCDIRLGACGWDGGRVMAFAAGELDLMADWYERICEAARSINRRQKDGRGGCNPSKFAALEDLVRDRASQIDTLICRGNNYLKYLLERTRQIENMERTGNWGMVSKIEAFRG